MNNKRRQAINNIANKINSIKDELQDIHSDEEYCMESIPENLQGSERYEQMEEICEKFEECEDLLEEITDILDEITSI